MTKQFDDYLTMTSIKDWSNYIHYAKDFKEIEENDSDETRWHKMVEHIVQHIPTGRFLAVDVRHPLTENQEYGEHITVREVKPVTRTVEVTEYVSILK